MNSPDSASLGVAEAAFLTCSPVVLRLCSQLPLHVARLSGPQGIPQVCFTPSFNKYILNVSVEFMLYSSLLQFLLTFNFSFNLKYIEKIQFLRGSKPYQMSC